MKPTDKYKTERAFRIALLDRLKAVARKENKQLPRIQRQVAFSQLLRRLFSDLNFPWVLKGGHALEMRLTDSRATKDIDIGLRDIKIFGSDPKEKTEALTEVIQEKISLDLGDFFSFKIDRVLMELSNAPYGGTRFLIEAQIDNRTFSKFHLDVAIGDSWIEPHDEIESLNFLSFTGQESCLIKTVSIEQHFSEKIHAYTMPREKENSRVKDLVDISLILKESPPDIEKLKVILRKTFSRRGAHALPKILIPPPETWRPRFPAMAEEAGLSLSMDESFEQLQKFYKKIVAE